MDARHEFGRRAEGIAERYFQLKGFELVARNFRTKRGELDLVMRKGKLVVFLEVKGRTKEWENSAWQSLWRGKKHRIAVAARIFMAKFRDQLEGADEFRCDLVFVTQNRVAEVYSGESLI